MSRDPRLLFNEAKLFCGNGLISMTCVQIWEDMKGAPVDPPFFLKEVPASSAAPGSSPSVTVSPATPTPMPRSSGAASTPSPPPAPAGHGGACLGDLS